MEMMTCSQIIYDDIKTQCRNSWTWFMDNLLDCIGPIEEREWVFQSHRQKGEIYTLLLFSFLFFACECYIKKTLC
jgi:hypothetical protein